MVRNRIRMYPGLVNCSTIDWFGEWPQEALMEVAERYLQGIDLNLGADTELLKVGIDMVSVDHQR